MSRNSILTLLAYIGDYLSHETEEQFTQLDEVLKHVVKRKIATAGILATMIIGTNAKGRN